MMHNDTDVIVVYSECDFSELYGFTFLFTGPLTDSTGAPLNRELIEHSAFFGLVCQPQCVWRGDRFSPA